MLIEVNKIFVCKDNNIDIDINIGHMSVMLNNLIINPNGDIVVNKDNPFCDMLLEFELLDEKEDVYIIANEDLAETIFYIYKNRSDSRRVDKIEKVDSVRII